MIFDGKDDRMNTMSSSISPLTLFAAGLTTLPSIPLKNAPSKSKTSSTSNKLSSSLAAAKTMMMYTSTQSLSLPSIKSATLLSTVANSDSETMTRLIQHYNYRNELTSVDVNGSTPIHVACKAGDVSLLKTLLEYKTINLDALEKRIVGGYSAVHLACQAQQSEMLSLLLQSGANPDIRADSVLGEMPLHLCCRLGYITCASILIRHGASVNGKDNYGNNPSFWAHSKQYDNMITMLNLPPPHTATPDEYLQIMKSNNTRYHLPSIQKSKKKGGGKSKTKSANKSRVKIKSKSSTTKKKKKKKSKK